MISGVIEKTIYQDLKTGYGHFSFRIGDKIISAKGYLPILTPFAPLSLEGNWQNKEFLFSKASFYSSNLGEIKVFLQNMNSKKQPSIMEALSFAGLVFFDKIENLEDFPLTLKENRTFLRSVSQILEWKKIMEWQLVYPGFPLSFFHTLIKKYTLKKKDLRAKLLKTLKYNIVLNKTMLEKTEFDKIILISSLLKYSFNNCDGDL